MRRGYNNAVKGRVDMSKQQSLFSFLSQTHSPPSPTKMSRLDNDAVLPVLSAGSSSELEESESQQPQYDTESLLSSERNQHTSKEIEICSHPYQPRSQLFPRKRFGYAKPEYRSFKVSWFDNRNWSNWLHWEAAKERVYCIICRNVYALGQLTMSRNREKRIYNNWVY